ncbi:MAG: hypothetical protein EZS28_041285, partial [Streblomastix strix]
MDTSGNSHASNIASINIFLIDLDYADQKVSLVSAITRHM